MINGELPAKTVGEFIALLKKNPGKYNFASAGTGSATHLSMAYFSNLAGVEMVHIPYKATNEAIQEVMVGRAHAVMASTIGALPFAKDSRVKMLAVSGAKRSKFAPELPTIAESGLAGYEFDSWMGLLGPAGMPQATVQQMNTAINELLRDPVILDRLAKQGVEPRALSPEAFTRLLQDDFARMERVVKAAGARIE
jgi:tripartite-type tricarboxylate transporter receptor subunit TctC